MSVSKRNALILSILHNPMPLKQITSLNIQYSTVSPKSSTIRPFLSLRLPILKFHNEHLQIAVKKERNPDNKIELKQMRPSIELVKKNGDKRLIYTDELKDDGDIINTIVNFDKE